jgi:hypothetical protein
VQFGRCCAEAATGALNLHREASIRLRSVDVAQPFARPHAQAACRLEGLDHAVVVAPIQAGAPARFGDGCQALRGKFAHSAGVRLSPRPQPREEFLSSCLESGLLRAYQLVQLCRHRIGALALALARPPVDRVCQVASREEISSRRNTSRSSSALAAARSKTSCMRSMSTSWFHSRRFRSCSAYACSSPDSTRPPP